MHNLSVYAGRWRRCEVGGQTLLSPSLPAQAFAINLTLYVRGVVLVHLCMCVLSVPQWTKAGVEHWRCVMPLVWTGGHEV